CDHLVGTALGEDRDARKFQPSTTTLENVTTWNTDNYEIGRMPDSQGLAGPVNAEMSVQFVSEWMGMNSSWDMDAKVVWLERQDAERVKRRAPPLVPGAR
ncbi:unnamed protein product, partial [Effrenium voratum]